MGGMETRSGRLLVLVPISLAMLGISATGAWWLRGKLQPVRADNTETLQQRGKLLYLASCASCHGVDGHGDGPSAAELKPSPRDFAHGAWKFGVTADAIRQVIRNGVP